VYLWAEAPYSLESPTEQDSHIPAAVPLRFAADADAGSPQFAALVSRLPGSCRPRGRGWSAAAASILEASAPKPGNVHPAAEFPDLSHAELVAAGLAIAPAMERAAEVPLGRTILAAVTAARSVTRSNANLGIVLAIAPLAAVPDACTDVAGPTRHTAASPAAVAEVLERLGPADAADVWQAIRLAQPGGMGQSGEHDLAGPPPDDLMAAMRLAAPHDAIARLWADGYHSLVTGLVADLDAAIGRGLPLNDAIVHAFLAQLAREPDSLIARKHGPAVALEVSQRAAAALAHPQAIQEFDRFLRSPRRLNPGSTADLTAAALYMLVREGRLLADFPTPSPPHAPDHE
jgi:triphosphoribosyl-dephospho-CoA synthase